MAQLNQSAYHIARHTGHCAITNNPLQPGDPYMAVLIEVDAPPSTLDKAATAKTTDTPTDAGLKRVDISISAWDQGPRPDGLFSYWRSTVPHSDEKTKLFVDDDVLLNLFHRLADTDQPQRLAFRFVLMLILMRKRLLKFVSSQPPTEPSDPQQYWTVKPKGCDETIQVLNPQLDDNQISQVTEQLGQILECEL